MVPSTSFQPLPSVATRGPSSHQQLPEHVPRMLLLYFFLSTARLLVLDPGSQVYEQWMNNESSTLISTVKIATSQQSGMQEKEWTPRLVSKQKELRGLALIQICCLILQGFTIANFLVKVLWCSFQQQYLVKCKLFRSHVSTLFRTLEKQVRLRKLQCNAIELSQIEAPATIVSFSSQIRIRSIPLWGVPSYDFRGPRSCKTYWNDRKDSSVWEAPTGDYLK